ncbi:GDP-mannose 4,6-dehydratase [Thermodesulfobacteriota bacterium]
MAEQSWNGRRVLVTGAGGFIGSHLVEQLTEAGALVRAFVRYNSLGSWGWLDSSRVKKEIEVLAGDVRDRDSVQGATEGIEVLFHLAALVGIPYSYYSPGSYVSTNIMGTLNVLQSARNSGVHLVVHTSTSEVYGTARYCPIDEDHPVQGQSPYSASKIAADKMAESFNLSFDFPVITVRPFNAFGPRQSARAVIPTIITQSLTSAKVSLGSLTPTRDFTFVRDTANSFLKAASDPNAVGQVINIGNGLEISIGDLAAKIASLLGRNVEITSTNERTRPDKSEVMRLCADCSKAHRLIGWHPKVSLEAGLEETIRWIQDNMESYRPDVYTI